MANYLYIAVLCFITFNHVKALSTVDGKIKITIGTTAGCSDTVTFVSTQLREAYESFGDFLEIEFVPWGRTRRDENEPNGLWCQFKANDCWANRVHRCALDLLKGNQDGQVQYMFCEFSTLQAAFNLGSYFCAQHVGLNLIELDFCVSTTGASLDAAAEEAARVPMGIIDFVPSIHFNDEIDIDQHNTAIQRLASEICFALAADPETGITSCRI